MKSTLISKRARVIFVATASFISAIVCETYGSVSPGAATVPTLSSVAMFRLFTEDGVSLDLQPGRTTKSTQYDKFSSKGELIFQNKGDGKGLIIGNNGSSEALVVSHQWSVQFLEFTGTGNLMVLTIYDAWNADIGGFYFVYQRQMWMAPFGQGGTYSTYWGYAKPWN